MPAGQPSPGNGKRRAWSYHPASGRPTVDLGADAPQRHRGYDHFPLPPGVSWSFRPWPASLKAPRPGLRICYASRLSRMTYPETITVRKVQKRGEFHWRGHRVFLGEALAGERVDLEPEDDRYWTVRFGPVVLGVFDAHRLVVVKPKPRGQRRGRTTESSSPCIVASRGPPIN